MVKLSRCQDRIAATQDCKPCTLQMMILECLRMPFQIIGAFWYTAGVVCFSRANQLFLSNDVIITIFQQTTRILSLCDDFDYKLTSWKKV
jgi:hypothetical protein